jgi:hypothetical protein
MQPTVRVAKLQLTSGSAFKVFLFLIFSMQTSEIRIGAGIRK